MSKGRILKVRPGHDANCSTMAYMGGILVSILGYAMILTMLIGMGGGGVLVSRAAKGAKRASGTVESPPAE